MSNKAYPHPRLIGRPPWKDAQDGAMWASAAAPICESAGADEGGTG